MREDENKPPTGAVDGGEGRGIPLGTRDDRPPTGYDTTQQPHHQRGDVIESEESAGNAPER